MSKINTTALYSFHQYGKSFEKVKILLASALACPKFFRIQFMHEWMFLGISTTVIRLETCMTYKLIAQNKIGTNRRLFKKKFTIKCTLAKKIIELKDKIKKSLQASLTLICWQTGNESLFIWGYLTCLDACRLCATAV